MDRRVRFVSASGPRRTIAALGGLYVALALSLAVVLLLGNADGSEVVGRFVMVAAPGLALLVGSRRVREMDLHPDAAPRIVIWTAGGIGVMGISRKRLRLRRLKAAA